MLYACNMYKIGLKQAIEKLKMAFHICVHIHVPIYRILTKEGPWAVHLTLGQAWGMGRYLRYQCHIYMRKSTQVSYPRYSFIICIEAAATIDFRLIQARLPIQSKGGHDISPCVVECIHVKWVWLRSLAIYLC